ncbi:MAG: DinB family protein [Saprospiraceae bacterium]|nr:DinB family protein [Saprospiraceae bacterium]
MKSLFNPDTFDHILHRVNQITPELKPQWGRMSAAQMLSHCAIVNETYTGDTELPKPNFIQKLFAPMIKKLVYGPKPYPHNTRTHPLFLQTLTKDFDTEKARLLKVMDKLRDPAMQDKIVNTHHVMFGTLKREELGWGLYKHLDHHLSQFGV